VLSDGRSDPSAFAAQAESLIRDEKVCAVFGCWTSASRKTVKPLFEKYNHLLIYPVQYEGLERSPNIVYTGATPNQQLLPAVKWCFTELGRRFYVIGSDYVYPRIASELVRDQVRELGGEVVGEAFLPLGANDVGGVVSEIAAARPSVVLNMINGDTNLAFFRALRAAGVTPDALPTMSFSLSAPEIRAIGPRDLAGDYAAWNYFMGIDKPDNHVFVRTFQEKYGPQRQTSDPIEAAYFGAHLWAKGVSAAGSIEPAAVRKAMGGLSFDAPEGRVWIDPTNQHTWKSTRIGRIDREGNFTIVFSSVQPIEPQPFPRFRSPEAWEELLLGLYDRWGYQWQAPAAR
jgi:urea transport system substrate-binding protein